MSMIDLNFSTLIASIAAACRLFQLLVALLVKKFFLTLFQQIRRLYVIRCPLDDWRNTGIIARSTFSILLKILISWIKSMVPQIQSKDEQKWCINVLFIIPSIALAFDLQTVTWFFHFKCHSLNATPDFLLAIYVSEKDSWIRFRIFYDFFLVSITGTNLLHPILSFKINVSYMHWTDWKLNNSTQSEADMNFVKSL